MRAICLLILLFATAPRTPQQIYGEAKAAYDAKDFATYLARADELRALRPKHPGVILNYAGALALNGRAEESVAQIERLNAMQVALDLADHDFDSLREREDFRAAAAKMTETRTRPVSTSRRSFTIPATSPLIEAITHDPKTNAFFVSSVHKRKILRVANGVARDFVTASIWGVNGLGVDAKRRILYATSIAHGRVEGFDKERHSESALYAFDADSGKQLARYEAPPKASVDDLTVAPDGTVFVSDSTGSVLRLRDGRLEPFARGMRSAQGSAFGRNVLYVADYGGAIWAVDPQSGDAARLTLPDDFTAVGIDGLEYANGALFAIQNGVEPNRVVRLTLDGLRVSSWQVVERNHPDMDEPTIGVVANSALHFIANSQGNKFDKGKGAEARATVVLRVKIE